MRKITVRDSRTLYTRITKRQARLLYKTSEVHACPCNLRPGYPWAPNIQLDRNREFDTMVNSATHYGCANNETGLYLAYYLVTIIGE